MLVFDTHAYIEDLTAVGFSSKQAEVQSKVMARALTEIEESSHRDLVTKPDLRDEVAELRSELKSEISDVRTDLIKWMVGIALTLLFSQAGFTMLLLKFLLPPS